MLSIQKYKNYVLITVFWGLGFWSSTGGHHRVDTISAGGSHHIGPHFWVSGLLDGWMSDGMQLRKARTHRHHHFERDCKKKKKETLHSSLA